MKWTPQAIVAVGLVLILFISAVGHEINRNLHPGLTNSVEWWGRILLTIVGGLLLYLGVTSNKKNGNGKE